MTHPLKLATPLLAVLALTVAVSPAYPASLPPTLPPVSPPQLYPCCAGINRLAPDTASELAAALRNRDPAIRRDLIARDMRVAMLGEQAFSPDWVVGIRRANNADRLVYARVVVTRVSGDGHVLEHRVDTCDVAIDSGLAGRIEDVWRHMIVDARTDPNTGYGLDGDSYLFVLPASGNGAHTWEPGKGTMPGMLVGIGFAMARFCVARQWWVLPAAWYFSIKLDRDVTRLHALLDREGK